MYMTQAARIECALPAALFHTVWKRVSQDDPAHNGVLELLEVAADEPLGGGLSRAELDRRLARIRSALLAPHAKDAIGKMLLSLAYFTRELTESGALILVEGSAFDQAFTLIMEGIAEHADLWDSFNRSAAKAAARMLKKARAAGYYNRRI